MVSLRRFNNSRFLSTFIDFGKQMKQLNDNGQFDKTVSLFENQFSKQENKRTTLVINQFLRACIELKDFKRGQTLHKSLSPYLSGNSYIATNLIHLYRKLFK